MTVRIAKIRTTIRMKPEAFPLHLDRDMARGWPCPYCWQPMTEERWPTWDHIVPRGDGGVDEPGNKIPVCFPCNNHKGNLSLPAYVGKLMATGDPRAVTVRAFLDLLIEEGGPDTAFEAQCYAEIGASWAWYRPRVRRYRQQLSRQKQARVTETANRMLQERLLRESRRREVRRVEIESAAHIAMAEIGIPRTHWSLDPPGHVKVLIGSLPERFPLFPVPALKQAIEAHPRAKFLARVA